MSHKLDAIVIGGGISGLVAAFELDRAGKSVALIEPGVLGGVIQSERRGEYLLESGPHTLGTNPELEQLISLLKLGSQVIEIPIKNLKQFVFWQGQTHLVPRSPLQLFSSRLMSLRSKVVLLHAILTRRTMPAPDASVRSAFTQMIGTEPTQRLVDAALRGIFGGDIDRLVFSELFPAIDAGLHSGRTLFQYFRERNRTFKRRVISFKGGCALLPTRLLEQLRERVSIINGQVRDLRFNPNDGEFILSTDEQHLSASTIYCATSGQATAQYLSTLGSELVPALATLRYAPIVLMNFVVPRGCIPPDSFGALVPRSAQSALMGVLHLSNLTPTENCSTSHALIAVCLGGIGHDDVCSLSDAELTTRAQVALKQLFALSVEQPIKLVRWPKAIPQYEEQHAELRQQMRRVENSYPGLHFIGADRGGVSVPDRVKCATQAVRNACN